jgi:hypothetical protein
MAEHRPDVKAGTPLETQHITAECRANRGWWGAWDDALRQLLQVYEAQANAHPGDTLSVAIYRTRPDAD